MFPRPVSLYIDIPLLRETDRARKEDRQSRSEFMREALREKLERRKKEKEAKA